MDISVRVTSAASDVFMYQYLEVLDFNKALAILLGIQ